MIKVNAELFRIAYAAVSKEETRYYLRGVYVEPHPVKGVTLTATDGNQLLCIHDESGVATEKAIIRLTPDALKACKIAKREHARVLTIEDGAKVNATVSVIEAEGDEAQPRAIIADCKIDGTFPDYRRVIPVPNPLQDSAVNPPHFAGHLIIAMGDTAIALKSKIRWHAADVSSPAIVLFEEAPHVVGVLMPMRSKASPKFELPAWYTGEK